LSSNNKERSLEIKTVRSVKRENQQRQKDRGRRMTPEPVLPPGSSAAGGDISSMCQSITSASWITSTAGGGIAGDGDDLTKEERELLTELEHPERVLETDPVLSQFSRSMSLPRNYDRGRGNWQEMKAVYAQNNGQQFGQTSGLQPPSATQVLRRGDPNAQQVSPSHYFLNSCIQDRCRPIMPIFKA
jgi:hypothetical protein